MNKNTTLFIASGFALIVAILISLIVIWISNLVKTNDRINEVLSEREESEFVFKMRDAAYNRAITLHRMALITDPFDRDDEYMRFRGYAVDFLRAQEQLLAMRLNDREKSIWERAKPLIQKGGQVQNNAASLIVEANNLEQANVPLMQVIPIQREVMDQLTEMMELQRGTVNSELQSVAKDANQTLIYAVVLGGLAILGSIIISIVVVSHNTRTQRQLIEEKRRAKCASEHKSLFLANMSHEIRTPLTSIIGYAEALLSPKQTENDKSSSVNTIIRNGKHLLTIINDILDLSKIESNKLEIEKRQIDLLEIVADIESLFGRLAREKGLSFNVNIQFPYPARVMTDGLRLKQVIINLVGNAIKFTSKGSVQISTRVDFEKEVGYIEVSDNGIGMSPEQLNRLFKPFTQGDASTTRTFGGTGLGLAISKNLAELLGGTISVTSEPNVGSKFTVSFSTGSLESIENYKSINDIKRVERDQDEIENIRLAGKVLLVEDSPDIRELVKMYLVELGINADAVENGKLAVESALAKSYDLILMDMQMPVMDGRDATRWLRQVGCATPIIALTANAMKEDIEQYERIGMNGFLAKPVDKYQFAKTLAKFLKTATTSDGPQVAPTINSRHAELLEKFRKSLPNTLDEIQSALASGDADKLRFVSHTLKGIGGSYGYPEITELSRDIETFAKQKQLSNAAPIVEKLISFCNASVFKQETR